MIFVMHAVSEYALSFHRLKGYSSKKTNLSCIKMGTGNFVDRFWIDRYHNLEEGHINLH